MAACLLCGSSQHKVICILQQDDLLGASPIFIEVLTQSLIKQGRGFLNSCERQVQVSCTTGWPSPSVHSKANISWLWEARGRLKKASFKSNTVSFFRACLFVLSFSPIWGLEAPQFCSTKRIMASSLWFFQFSFALCSLSSFLIFSASSLSSR